MGPNVEIHKRVTPSFRNLVGCLLFLTTLGWAQEKAPHEYAWEDPTKIKTANTCRQCHVAEYEVWAKTGHAKGFKTLHRRKSAEAIAEKMGFDLIKRESLCLTCHYTPIIKNDTLRAVSGVSCESCHGASADWLTVHNQYGGKGFTYENETPEHKANRIKTTREMGMRRPSDLYPVASRCFQCHTVPHEGLVNKGGHGTGSSDFELVEWSQGEIRHNFFESFLTGDGTVNAERSPERKRLMYVLGRALDVEYSLRGIAVAKEKKRYFKAMSRRLRSATSEVRAIHQRVNMEPLADILALIREARIVPDNETELMEVSTKIGDATKRFLGQYDGSELTILDPLISGDEVAEEFVEAEPVAPTPTGEVVADSSATQAEAEKPADGTSDKPLRAQVQKVAAVPASGAKKSRLRPQSTHKTIGPGKCSGCHEHESQSTWWYEDRHSSSADPFFENSPEYLKIAKLYGLNTAGLARGTVLCMDCHATVVSGRENREVNDGVSCEACHGPAADYLDPHQDGNAGDGLQRSGYLAAIKQGMTPKDHAEKRAQACASCHYITDERLLSAGHTSGKSFDYLKGLASIKHWENDTLSSAQLQTAFQAVKSARGPVPEVRLAREAVVINAPGKQKQDPSKSKRLAKVLRNPENKKVARPAVPRARPLLGNAPSEAVDVGPLALPPFPEIQDNTPLDEVLTLLKQRLEAIHQKVRDKGGKGS